MQDRYRSLVENMPGIAYVWEVHPGALRPFSYVSPRVKDILGFSPEEWQPCDRVHPHDQASVAEAVDRSAQTGAPFRMEYRFLANDGSVVWVLDHATLIIGPTSATPLVPGVMLDITARKEAESEGRSRRGPVPYPRPSAARSSPHVRPRLRGEDDDPSGRHLHEPAGRRPRPIPRRALAREPSLVRDGPSRRSRARRRDHGGTTGGPATRGRSATG